MKFISESISSVVLVFHLVDPAHVAQEDFNVIFMPLPAGIGKEGICM